MMPWWDQTGVPGLVGLTHFHSSTTSGSACLMSLRILLRVSPRQSPSSAILLEMSAEADRPSLASDFFMVVILDLLSFHRGHLRHPVQLLFQGIDVPRPEAPEGASQASSSISGPGLSE